MLLRRAVLAAHPRTPAAACLLPNLGLHTQTILQSNTWRCHQSPVAPATSHIQQAAAAHPTVAPAPAAAAVAAVTQRGLCLRCYSNSAASTSGSSTSDTNTGPRKLKYNLRPLNKGEDAHEHEYAYAGPLSQVHMITFAVLGSGLFPDCIVVCQTSQEMPRVVSEALLPAFQQSLLVTECVHEHGWEHRSHHQQQHVWCA